MQLENAMLMYGVHNAETLEKLILLYISYTIPHPHMKGCLQDNIVLQQLEHYAHSLGLHHYSTNSLLYLRTIQDIYITLYRELISQLCIYASAIRILAKRYLPNTLITAIKLKEICNEVRKTASY